MIGILFIVRPQDSLEVAAMIAGVVIVANGIFDLIYYFRVWADFYSRGSLFEGIMKCVLGIFIITHAGIMTVLFSYVFSIYIIINGIICIETMPGDSFEKIAGYYGIKLKKLLQYNDKSSSTLDPGQLVFLKKKKSKAARGYEFHRVKAGDTMYSISQQYGVRLKNLCRFNYLSADSPLTEGEKIYLRKQADLL